MVEICGEGTACHRVVGLQRFSVFGFYLECKLELLALVQDTHVSFKLYVLSLGTPTIHARYLF